MQPTVKKNGAVFGGTSTIPFITMLRRTPHWDSKWIRVVRELGNSFHHPILFLKSRPET